MAFDSKTGNFEISCLHPEDTSLKKEGPLI
ncbi:MAG: hypothetical protein JWO06_1064 [Bacteroidota bacterium]|nr:hypothetical protein [Bacteroidota bacterium]